MAGQIISYDRKAEQISLRDKDRVNWFTELSVNVSRLIQPFFYSDVTLKNKEIFTNLAIEKQGALIIPNHVEYMDSIAVATSIYQAHGMPPYFVSKFGLRPHVFFESMGCISYERGCDLKRALKDLKLHSKDPEQKIIQRTLLHEERQASTYRRVSSAINSGSLVTVYLQGHRKPGQTTNIKDPRYQKGLENWLSCLGESPIPIVPLNISHNYLHSADSRMPVRKEVVLTAAEPIYQTEGIDAVIEHLAENISVFTLE